MLSLLIKITIISIHALRGEGDYTKAHGQRLSRISIHALRGEGDGRAASIPSLEMPFQSTPSVGRATFVCFAYS